MGNNDKRQINWININDQCQCKWALNYLKKKNISLKYFVSSESFEDLKLTIAALRQDDHETYQKMKDAWNQKVYRDKKNGRKSYNFVLNTQLKGRLKSLSSRHKLPMNQTIELLINSAFDYKKQEYSHMKAVKREEKVKYEKLKKEYDELRNEIKRYIEDNKKLNQECDDMTAKLAKVHLSKSNDPS